MTPDDKLIYLKNIVVVAHSDEQLSPAEEIYLEQVRVDIKATKPQLKTALAGSDDHTIDLSFFPRLSMRLRNFEDLVGLALADGNLAQEEKLSIISAAKDAGITQDLVDVVLREAKTRRSGQSQNCAQCGHTNPSGCKFCSNCGAKTDGPQPTASKATCINVPSVGITITFAKSSSNSFPMALTIAKKFPTYQEAVRSGTNWYAVSVNTDSAALLFDLVDKIRSLRNKEVFVDGTVNDWNDTFGFASCALERANSYKPVEYCFGLDDGRFNIWGCTQLQMDWTNWADWFTYGRFLKKDIYEFDLGRIEHELHEQMNRVGLCPHLRKTYIAAVLDHLPRQVRVSSGGEWDYRTTYDPDPRAISVTIIRDYGNGYKDKETINAIGVQPRDSKTAIAILKKAAKQSGSKDLDPKRLLSGP